MKKGYDISIVVGDNIRKVRIAQNVSQNQLAYETGLSREFINRVESGKNNISIKKLALIADALNIEPKELLVFTASVAKKTKKA